jgi:hypothetical protein
LAFGMNCEENLAVMKKLTVESNFYKTRAKRQTGASKK